MEEKRWTETRDRQFCPRHGHDRGGCARVERLLRSDPATARALNEATERRLLEFVERHYPAERIRRQPGVERSIALFHRPLEGRATGGWPAAKLYLACHRASLCPAEVTWIHVELAARVSCWEVLQRLNGGGAHVADALGDAMFTLPAGEVPIGFRFRPGELVLARIFDVLGRRVLAQFHPAPVFHPWSGPLLERLRRLPEPGREAALLAAWEATGRR
jgi:hypothetical protein